MKTTAFVAESAAEALAQIRVQLGPTAVVVDVRRLSGNGLSRLWQKPRIQVLAGVPEMESSENKPMHALLQKIAELNHQLPPMAEPDRNAIASILENLSELVPSPATVPPLPLRGEEGQGENSPKPIAGLEPLNRPLTHPSGTLSPTGGEGWGEGVVHREVSSKTISPFEPLNCGASAGSAGVPPARAHAFPRIRDQAGETPALPATVPGDGTPIAAALESLGLLPSHAHRIAERVRVLHGVATPGSLERDLATAKAVLDQLWRQPPWKHEPGTPQTHVFIGAPGTGKTTSLCKWLAQVVLLGGRSAQVWRLDGRTANTAEALSVYAEILGVPTLRSWSPAQGRSDEEMLFIDLPGVDWRDGAAVAELGQRLREFEGAHVHLVLNVAYEMSLLLDQVQAFSAIPIADLICTHLDEEHRRGKLWNLALGTNHALSFLTAGQNVPGYFRKASADQLWPDEFPAKADPATGNTPAQPRWQSIC